MTINLWYLIVGTILYFVGLIIIAIGTSDLADFFAFAVLYFVGCIFWLVLIALVVVLGLLTGFWHLVKFLERKFK